MRGQLADARASRDEAGGAAGAELRSCRLQTIPGAHAGPGSSPIARRPARSAGEA
jgi:hypothetical protein